MSIETIVSELQTEIEAVRDNAWDAGYLRGVGDARAHPAKADALVQEIIADGAADYYETLQDAVANWSAYAASVRD
jgi:hypothetical protein